MRFATVLQLGATMLASHQHVASQQASQLLWGAEVPSNDVQEERQVLRSLLASDYGQFKTIIFGDPLATLPADKNFDQVIEDYLRKRYGDLYSAEVAD